MLQENIDRERKRIQEKNAEKIDRNEERQAADNNFSSTDMVLDQESDKHHSNLASARMLLASMIGDLAMLRFIDSVLSKRLSFLHPRVLHLREEYQNKDVRPSIDLAILNTKAARAQVTLFEAMCEQHGRVMLSRSKLEGLKRNASFARWCVANNVMHK